MSITQADVESMLDRYGYPTETRQIIATENLLPAGLLGRLHAAYPGHSGLFERHERLFTDRDHYSGLEGFRQVIAILSHHGIQLGNLTERELFAEVYRFKATRHALNCINWQDYEGDSMFQLMFPQPGMMQRDLFGRASPATTYTRPIPTTPTSS
jgi:lysine 2,3-aminomutase